MAMEFTEQNFDAEVLETDVPVLVDFWAPWCGPCKMMGPVIEELAQEFEGRAKVGKVNVDDNKALAERFGVMSIPTLIIFKNGQSVGQMVGAAAKNLLSKKLEQLI
ncbi:MAG: thioredoxin [Firmicutes bacterium]|nr:thioredoxin [Bacillota bacterium]